MTGNPEGEPPLPLAHTPDVDVYEIRTRVVPHPSTTQLQGRIAHFRSCNPLQTNVDRFRLHVEAVPLEDGLVWAALHQDAIVVQLPERTGPLAGEPAAALLRRGSAG